MKHVHLPVAISFNPAGPTTDKDTDWIVCQHCRWKAVIYGSTTRAESKIFLEARLTEHLLASHKDVAA